MDAMFATGGTVPRPLVDSTLVLPGGRRLAYALYGAGGGRPVLFFHGFPGSRYHGALVDGTAAAADVCVIAFDRAGFGGSTYVHGQTLATVAEDAAHLADHLGHARFDVVGTSCGGPYALATARRWPARVRGVGLLAGIGPTRPASRRRGQLPVLRMLFGLARIHPALTTPLLALDRRMYLRAPDRAVASLARLLTPPDRALLGDVRVRRAFAHGLAEAYRAGLDGARADIARIVALDDSMFDGVTVPVHVYQGQHDRHVPPSMGQHLAERLPTSHWHFCPTDGHLSIVVHHFAACVAQLQATAGAVHA